MDAPHPRAVVVGRRIDSGVAARASLRSRSRAGSRDGVRMAICRRWLSTTTSQSVICAGCVRGELEYRDRVALWLLIVCTPSENVKAVGVTAVSGMFAASGPANVTIAVTKSLVV